MGGWGAVPGAVELPPVNRWLPGCPRLGGLFSEANIVSPKDPDNQSIFALSFASQEIDIFLKLHSNLAPRLLQRKISDTR